MTSGTNRAQRSSLLIWFVTAVVTTAVAAEPQATADDTPSEPWGVNQLMSELGRVQHAKARFVERKHLKVLKTPLESTGTLEYDAPDRLVKRTLEPKPETMTVAGERLVIESQARSRTLRLGDYPVLGAFVESLRATLNGDLAALERFYRVTLEGGPQRWQLTLTPRDPKMSALIESILIGGGHGRVGRVEVRETRGDRSVMTVLEDVP